MAIVRKNLIFEEEREKGRRGEREKE